MAQEKITPRHILIYKHNDGEHFVSVGVDKVNGKWTATGSTEMPLADYDGWLAFLKQQGHTIRRRDLDQLAANGVPVIAVKPGSTWVEAIEGAAWFTVILRGEINKQ